MDKDRIVSAKETKGSVEETTGKTVATPSRSPRQSGQVEGKVRNAHGGTRRGMR
jgi:hypothetical protein